MLRSTADKDLNGPAIKDGWPATVIRETAEKAGRCAFVYRITEEAKFAERARELMNAVLDTDDGWTKNYIIESPLQFHLSSAALCHGLALAYDMMAEEMTGEERLNFVEVCRQKAIKPFLEDCKLVTNPCL